MNKLLEKANRKFTTGKAAALIGSAFMFSRLLGLLRDRLLVAHFGVSAVTDAYAAAFRLPDLLLTLLVSGATAVALIPVLNEHWHKGEEGEAWDLASNLINILGLIMLGVGIVIFIFASPLVSLITPGFDAYRHALTVNMTRIMLLTPMLFAVSSVIGSIAQAFGRFLFFSLAGVFYNVGIIIGILLLSPHFGIYGVAWGVVLGAGLQMVMQLFGLIGLGYKYRWTLNWRNRSLRKVIGLMIPRSIDQGIDQINYTVETVIGSNLKAGSLTAYYVANNLKNVPMVLFGTSIATAAFPALAASAAAGDRTGVVENFVVNARLILFLVLPAATATFLLRGYIVRLLFGFGNQTTANTLGLFAGTILFQSLFFLVARVYYANQDTKTPLFTSIFAIGLNILLSIVLSHHLGVEGLALAQSIVSGVEVCLLLLILQLRYKNIGLKQIMQGLVPMVIANSIMAGVIYMLIARGLPLFRVDRGLLLLGPKFLAIVAVGAVAYLVPCYILRLKEARLFMRRLFSALRLPVTLD